MQTLVAHRWLPIFGLMVGATFWGIVWYPFRLLHAVGVSAPVATSLCYAVTILLGGVLFWRAWREFLQYPWILGGIALAAGVANVSYLVAIMQGEVVRIVLLFYLAPLWTVPLARLLLDEKLTLAGFATMLIAFTGAVVMLWQPALGFPAPRNAAEWLGVLGGFGFAVNNVLIRRATYCSGEAVSLTGALGVLVVALPVSLLLQPHWVSTLTITAPYVGMIVAIGVLLLLTALAMQYGLSRTPANRAAVVLLFELVVAAVAAHFLANESTRLQDWIGGIMIVAAGFVATMGKDAPEIAKA